MNLLPIVCDKGVLPEYLLQRQRMVFLVFDLCSCGMIDNCRSSVCIFPD